MRPNVRMGLCTTSILLSAVYGLLVVKSPELARTIMLGYVGILLTIIAVCHIWGRHQ